MKRRVKVAEKGGSLVMYLPGEVKDCVKVGTVLTVEGKVAGGKLALTVVS